MTQQLIDYLVVSDSNKVVHHYNDDGQLHNDTCAALVIMDNDYNVLEEQWYQNGKLHRDNGPAVSNKYGSERWYQHGKLHRIGEPAVTIPNVYIGWYQNGNLHRTDGPAETFSGAVGKPVNFFYINGVLVPELWVTITKFFNQLCKRNCTKAIA